MKDDEAILHTIMILPRPSIEGLAMTTDITKRPYKLLLD